MNAWADTFVLFVKEFTFVAIEAAEYCALLAVVNDALPFDPSMLIAFLEPKVPAELTTPEADPFAVDDALKIPDDAPPLDAASEYIPRSLALVPPIDSEIVCPSLAPT